MYLLDTNIILELLLNQERSDEVERFLQTAPRDELHISEFSLYSCGILLVRRGLQDIFTQMVNDLLLAGGIRVLRLGVEDMATIAAISRRYNLDFDDAYQYAAAQHFRLTIVSFDTDFDRTELGRRTPADLQPRHRES